MSGFDRSSSLCLDQAASQLRSLIIDLHNILEIIERTHRIDEDFIKTSLKGVEGELRRLRKSID